MDKVQAYNLVKRCCLMIWLWMASANCLAQTPAHFIFGEDQFRGIHIYDLVQDKELNYWIATNDGLYFYDYLNLRKVLCKKAKSNSVFNFKKNNKGVIYCHNLNNQIFEIKNNGCQLFYELKEDEGCPDIILTIGQDDNLLIGGRKLLLIDSNGRLLKKYDAYESYLSEPFVGPKGEVYFPVSGQEYVVKYSKQNFSKCKLSIDDAKSQNLTLRYFTIAGKCFATDHLMQKQFDVNTSLLQLKPNKAYSLQSNLQSRIYETGNELWIAGTQPGVDYYKQLPLAENHKKLFEDYYIANVYKDNEGNFLLSTFDKGIIVIPDMKVPEVVQSYKDDPITAIYADKDLGIILGTSKGSIIEYGNARKISNKGIRPIDQIYGNAKSNFIIYDDGQIKAYNKLNGQIVKILERSLKDAVFISNNIFYLGTNTGVYKGKIIKDNVFEISLVKELSYRIHSLSYDEKSKILYAATAAGLYGLDSNMKSEIMVHNGEKIFANKLYFANNKLYASDNEAGLLTIENRQIIDTILLEDNGNKEQVLKMIIDDNILFAKTSNGFYQLDKNGKLVKSIPSVFGFNQKRVIDFVLFKNILWVSHSGGLQQIDMRYYHDNIAKPIVRINKLFVNDTAHQLSKNLSLKSKERKISFELCAPTLRNRETIHYHYRLLGYEDKWNINNTEANTITYNALSAGQYTFEVKVENLGAYSNTIRYSFSISPPFFAQWWFISGAMLLFVFIVYLVYRWQISVQQKKSQQLNELNTSKLTAIKSQMNPHFIFNSLNSIQDLILKGDVENSYSYITTFSNLVRSTLNHSEQDFIDFEQELKLLELYLSLEKLRFKKKLNYSIVTNDIEDIMLPPLIIQPFIENALVHGLLHKEGDKKLNITFELKEFLVCTIEDNGVGRERANLIKNRQRSGYESFSSKAISKRFEILQKIFKGNFGFQYIDLFENQKPVGTRVILTIPVKYKY